MAAVNRTQEDAATLLAMEKHKADDAVYEYPSLGGGIRVPLLSPDKRESFFLHIPRSQIKLTKGTYRTEPEAWRFWLGSDYTLPDGATRYPRVYFFGPLQWSEQAQKATRNALPW